MEKTSDGAHEGSVASSLAQFHDDGNAFLDQLKNINLDLVEINMAENLKFVADGANYYRNYSTTVLQNQMSDSM